jgi:methylglutaconyl-CoA hydratase
MPGQVDFECRSGSAWITLASPETRNALSQAMLADLADCLERALADPAVRCLVITGQGPAFCAGADLKAGRSEPGSVSFRDILARLWFSPKPVIAAVNGAAFGGGLGLVCVADIVIASERGRFAFSEVRLGVVPTVVSVFAIPRLGEARANRLFLTGSTLDARSAEKSGLVDHVVAEGDLAAAVADQVAEIARGAPQALAVARALTRRWQPEALAEMLRRAEDKTRAIFAGLEAAEGIAAFREKRDPNWIVGK